MHFANCDFLDFKPMLLYRRHGLFCLHFLIRNEGISMHITEGILPTKWVFTWFIVLMPFVGIGLFHVKRKKKTVPGYLPLIGMMGANNPVLFFSFVLHEKD